MPGEARETALGNYEGCDSGADEFAGRVARAAPGEAQSALRPR
ncbi:hypothetical protein Xcel_1874 [Xylanimonas cellulosilytica DSM 15894]|uniref:Uncharacterized protein n=1 Tax=Xylanimonas cellulosilytica (strain DSM 15894 / JCM 12276 / CECT 5975 / KCTC 9989 / LMG 20990 / NBRC 107835 / XIL07) TaxID=446471 RepID=D1BT51_XYLCX|nr:hypothetical protein Xcel_1874 [Xylanimonas cellulosilytica DSM 15894]